VNLAAARMDGGANGDDALEHRLVHDAQACRR
jgi:hypothetical protein